MKIKYIAISTVMLSSMILSSCEGWLTEQGPGVTDFEDYLTSGEAAKNLANGAYAPLSWEYNYTYYNDFFIGDIVSDDALKGGQNISDMSDVYDLENFKTIANNGLLHDYYRSNYQGIGRCNLALSEIPKVEADTALNAELKDRILGEMYFLRAAYYFNLVKVFGGVPLITTPIESSDSWIQPRALQSEVYAQITKDLLEAETLLWTKSQYPEKDLGRVTKGSAQAYLAKVYLYNKDFANAEIWANKVILSGEYGLEPKYANNFDIAFENGVESVFEVQYTDDPTSDFGGSGGEGGMGYTRGTFSIILTRSRSSQLGGGWGFNKPTQNLYDEFEFGDPRRDATILNPTDAQIENTDQEIYLGSRYLSKKLGYYDTAGQPIELSHSARGPLNRTVVRYSDVLLIHAEAALENGNLGAAKQSLEKVRERARQGQSNILPAFPDYNGYQDNDTDLRKAIRHERRVELAMEGHRWFDLCRWGVAKEVMDAYKAQESEEARSHMAEFVKGKHELFPIPAKEIELNPMEQNPMY